MAGKIRSENLPKYWGICLMIAFPILLEAAVEVIGFGGVNEFLRVFDAEKLANMCFSAFLAAVLFFVLLFLVRRVWLAALVSSATGVLFAFVNYQKITIRNSPFIPSDFYLAERAGDLSGFIGDLYMPVSFFVSVAVIGIYIIIAAATIRPITPRFLRSFTVYALCVSLCGMSVSAAFTAIKPYNNSSPISALYSKGFFANFIAEMLAVELKPFSTASSDLTEEDLKAELVEISDDEVPPLQEGQVTPDVIIILSEAFWNPMHMQGVEIVPNPTQNFDRLSDESVTFNLVSPTFGGGTVVPEFELLSGLSLLDLSTTSPYQQYIKAPVPTIASYFKDYGYRTVALHSFDKAFYGRDKVYDMFGFDDFIDEARFPEDAERNGSFGYITDKALTDQLLLQLDQASEDGQPTFVFAITMGNHGLYLNKFNQYDVQAITPDLNAEQNNKIINLAQGVYSADVQLQRLVDALRERERPAVLLFFADHLPSMGPGYDVFIDSGYVSTDELSFDNEEWLRMHTCSALIWSNYKKFAYDAGTMSPYFATTVLLDYINFPKNKFYQFLDYYKQQLPVKNSRLSLLPDLTLPGEMLPALSYECALRHVYYSRSRIFTENAE